MQDPAGLVSRKRQASDPSAFRGDPTAAKLESIVRQYHRGVSAEGALTLARRSFRDWRSNPRLATRADNAIQMLDTYISYDEQFPGGELIELFRRSEVPIANHLVRVRRDVLFFGLNGHRLRAISWRKERVPRELLSVLFCPVVLSVDQDVGQNRLEELQYWEVRPQVTSSVDISSCRNAVVDLVRFLDSVSHLLAEEDIA